jgi:hypothetical protein
MRHNNIFNTASSHATIQAYIVTLGTQMIFYYLKLMSITHCQCSATSYKFIFLGRVFDRIMTPQFLITAHQVTNALLLFDYYN